MTRTSTTATSRSAHDRTRTAPSSIRIRTSGRWQPGRRNPYGLWRFLAPGQQGIQPAELVPVMIPQLVVLFAAMETEKGRPLTRDEVEDLVSKSPCIAMEHADARTLEQSRGYVDIEPELAWEQWQIVRATT